MLLSLLQSLSSNILYFMLHLSSVNSFPKPLNAKEEYDEFVKFHENGDINARNKLVNHNMRLVAHIIKKYYSNYSDQEDIISIGTIGLIKAINTFDYKKGTRLATYASRCIENAILAQMRLWFQTILPRAGKHQNGVFWHTFPKIYTYFVPLWTAM